METNVSSSLVLSLVVNEKGNTFNIGLRADKEGWSSNCDPITML